MTHSLIPELTESLIQPRLILPFHEIKDFLGFVEMNFDIGILLESSED
jgi:hypothetical protein